MVIIQCFIHGMNGNPVGYKVFVIKGICHSTITITKHIYSNIVKVDGKLKKIGGVN